MLSRADPFVSDHGGFLLFRNPRVGHRGALDTAVTPERGVGERVHHKTKSFSAMARAVGGAVRHYAAQTMGWTAGQNKRSLLDTASAATRNMHLMAQRSNKATRHPRTLSFARATDDAPAEQAIQEEDDSVVPPLLITYLVHFSDKVVLNGELLAEFKAKTGLTLGAYFPHRSYLLVATQAQVADVRQNLDLDFVDWIGEFPNEAKVVSPQLHELVLLSAQAREERAQESVKTQARAGVFALNVQLQPLDGQASRTDEQLAALASLVVDFLSAHDFSSNDWDVVHSPSFHNDLLIVRSKKGTTVTVASAAHLLDLLSELVEVHVIEARTELAYRNEIAQQLTQSGGETAGPNGDGRTVWARGLQGEGQIVGCADSGSDYDHCFFNGAATPAPTSTPNLSLKKTIAYVVLPGADKTDDVGGHGTHVTGSIVGHGGTGDILAHSGQAPEAKLFFQDIGLTGGGLDGLGDVTDLGSGIFGPAYDAGARIHSDSWGSMDNTYSTYAQSVDAFIWQSGGDSVKNMLILVAAGNDGLKEGSVSGTVGSPATAKNIISVGASQTTNAGWLQSTEYTNWAEKQQDARAQLEDPNLQCCSSSNIAVLKYCCETYLQGEIQGKPDRYNDENMADFSSRGPTADGRVKPELVAPGQYIISARSDGKIDGGAGQCASVQSALTSMAGTSMATPIAAGCAALVRQYLVEGWSETGSKPASAPSTVGGRAEPSAALMAAMLINGAQSLTGTIDQNNDGSVFAPLSNGIFPLSVFQGFGRITLDRSLWFAGETRYNRFTEDSAHDMHTGDDRDYCFTTSATGPIKATMVYSDAPGQVGAGVAAVNNLDVYIGSSSEDAVAGNFVQHRDTLNNAESAIYNAKASGTQVFVKVRAVNVPTPGQRYALVVSGMIDTTSLRTGTACAADSSGFAITESRFAVADDSDHFPLGPVVGGAVGGAAGLAIILAVARYCWTRYRNSGTII